MDALTLAFLLLATLSEVTGTLALRQSDGLRRTGWVAVTLSAYAVAFCFLSLTLHRGLAVGVAYGIWAAVGIVLTALAGRLLLGEPLTPTMSLGVAVVLAGVLLVELG